MPTKALTAGQLNALQAWACKFGLRDGECCAETALRRISELEAENKELRILVAEAIRQRDEWKAKCKRFEGLPPKCQSCPNNPNELGPIVGGMNNWD